MIEAERERRQADTTRGVFTCRDLFTVISYADPATASAVALALTVAAPGRLDTTIWRPELKSGDLLILSSESSRPLN